MKYDNYVENALKLMEYVTESQGYEWNLKKSIEYGCRCWTYKSLIVKLVRSEQDDLCKNFYDTFYCLRIDEEGLGNIELYPIKRNNFKNVYYDIQPLLRFLKRLQL